MPPKKGPATPRGSPKKKASPTHRTGPWVIGARDKKEASIPEEVPSDGAPPIPESAAPPVNEKPDGPCYDPTLFAINTPPRAADPADVPLRLDHHRSSETPSTWRTPPTTSIGLFVRSWRAPRLLPRERLSRRESPPA